MKTTTLNTEKEMVEFRVRLPGHLLEIVNDIALETHTDIQTLMQNYIYEGMMKAQPKQKQRNFIKHSQKILAAHHVPPVDKDNIAEKFTYKYL